MLLVGVIYEVEKNFWYGNHVHDDGSGQILDLEIKYYTSASGLCRYYVEAYVT
jgi:hypothetical protein